jgi:hypothetical protein
MKKNMVKLFLLVVGITVIMGSTVAFGAIIPLAQQAKDKAVAPDYSPVIELIEGDWVLTPLAQNAGAGTVFIEDSIVLPLSDQGKESGAAPDHSPVIDLIEGDWVLIPSSQNVVAVTDTVAGDWVVTTLVQEPIGVPQDISFTVVPEPSTLLLLGAGALLFKKRRV